MQAEKTVIYFKYRIQRTVAKQYLEQIKVIAEGLKSNSDYSTMRKVHDYLARTVKYNPRVELGEEIYRIATIMLSARSLKKWRCARGLQERTRFY